MTTVVSLGGSIVAPEGPDAAFLSGIALPIDGGHTAGVGR